MRIFEFYDLKNIIIYVLCFVNFIILEKLNFIEIKDND